MKNLNQFINEEKSKPKEIDIKELFLVILRKIKLIVIIISLSIIVGVYLINVPTTPLYQTSSRIIIGADDASRNTLQVIVKDSIILDNVVKDLHLNISPEELANRITVASVNNTQVVSINVIDTDPIRAAKIADKTAQIVKDKAPEIYGQGNIRLLSQAKINPIPINPKSNNKLFISIIVGVVVSIGLAFLLESFDDKIRSESEVESLLGIPVLGKVSKATKRNIKKKRKSIAIDLEPRGDSIGYK